MERISNIVRHRLLANELRRLREDATLTGPMVAKDLGWSTSKLSRLEAALIKPVEQDVRTLLDYFQVPRSDQDTLLQLARQAAQRNWWDQHAKALPKEYIQVIGLEHEATSVLEWQLGLVPGLLQTEDYAGIVNGTMQDFIGMSPGAVRLRTRVRLKRQELLFDPDPLELTVVIDQSVLLRSIGGPAVMRPQLDHLAKMAERPNISVRVLKLDEPYALFVSSAMTQIQFAAADPALAPLPDISYLEHHLGGSLVFDEEITHPNRRMFQQLIEASLSPDESVELIKSTAAGIGAGPAQP